MDAYVVVCIVAANGQYVSCEVFTTREKAEKYARESSALNSRYSYVTGYRKIDSETW